MSTGSSPRSDRSSWYAPSFSPSANDQDSPCWHTLGRELAEGEVDVVAVRPDQADAALDLPVADLDQGGQHLLLEDVDVGDVALGKGPAEASRRLDR
jgi:hypothetical protein